MLRVSMANEEKRPKKKVWRRALAVLLAVTLVASPVVMLKTQIEFSRLKYVEETAAYAAQVTEDETDYLNENRLNRAWKYLQTVVRKPETYHDYELYAQIAIAREDFESAAKYLEGCLETADGEGADPAVINLRLASLLVLNDERDKAAEYLDRAIELDPSLAAAYYLRGQLAAEAGDAEAAVADLKSYVSLPNADPNVVAQLAQLFEGTGDLETAVDCYTAGIDYQGDANPALYLARARCRVLLENLTAARHDLQTYFSLTDEDPDGQAAAIMAMCLMNEGDYEGATTYFNQAVDAGYADPALLYSQSVKSGFAAGNYPRAVADGLKALKILEGDGAGSRPEGSAPIDATEIRFWVGLSYLAQNKYKEALEHLTKVRETEAAYADIDYYAGVCELALEDYEAAETSFTASIEKDEDVTASYYNRAVCRIRLERLSEARTDLEAVVERSDEADLKAQAEELLAAF